MQIEEKECLCATVGTSIWSHHLHPAPLSFSIEGIDIIISSVVKKSIDITGGFFPLCQDAKLDQTLSMLSPLGSRRWQVVRWWNVTQVDKVMCICLNRFMWNLFGWLMLKMFAFEWNWKPVWTFWIWSWNSDSLSTNYIVYKKSGVGFWMLLCWKYEYLLSVAPVPVTVTTRIITCFIGDTYKPLFATVTGRGLYPKYLGSWEWLWDLVT